MPHASREVAPTLVAAVRRLARDDARGYTFVQADGAERFFSFRCMAAECERRAAHLVNRGLRPGDRLAMVVPEGDEFVLSFLGALFAGVVPVPIYPHLTFKNVEGYHDTLSHIAAASGAAMLLTTPSARTYVDPVVPRLPAVRGVLTTTDLAGDATAALPDVRPEQLAFLQFTSGSTSRPKGVMVTHANLAANAAAFMIDGLGRDPAVDKGVSWLPLFHDMGLIGFVVGPLFTDVPCVLLPTASFVRTPRVWLEAIHRHRGTITYAPNFAYALVAKRLKEKDVAALDLSCLRIAGCGAEPIQPGALRDFAQRLAPAKFDPRAFLPSYGMAEATLAITFVPRSTGLRTDVVDPKALAGGRADASSAEDAREIVDCGAPFPGHELAVVDESGRPLPEGHVGQIVARGPSVTPGYFEEPELTAATLRPLAGGGEPWLHTGDLGYLKGGHLFVCGRVKDLIIVRGKNFYPSDIEWAVSELPGVRRGNVVAFAVDVAGEEQLVVCAEALTSEAAGLVPAIASCVSSQFGLVAHEVRIVAQGGLPRTSSGKAQRRKARQMFLDGTLPRPRAAAALEAAPE